MASRSNRRVLSVYHPECHRHGVRDGNVRYRVHCNDRAQQTRKTTNIDLRSQRRGPPVPVRQMFNKYDLQQRSRNRSLLQLSLHLCPCE
jgi:hypothetical protein